MKIKMDDVTFLILVRLDSIQRIENILAVTQQFYHYFKAKIVVREADSYNNGILESLLNKKIDYEFVEDKDPVLYKTRHFNQMTSMVTTSYLAIWDTDIIVDKSAVISCIDKLRKGEADIAYPYNGICYDIPTVIKNIYFTKPNIRLLYKNVNKMDKLYPHLLVGGAVLMDRKKYIQAGMENELHYGWGNDDFDRYYRFAGLGYRIHRVNTPLFHLPHPRGDNSRFRSPIFSQISSAVRFRVESSSKQELEKDIESFHKLDL